MKFYKMLVNKFKKFYKKNKKTVKFVVKVFVVVKAVLEVVDVLMKLYELLAPLVLSCIIRLNDLGVWEFITSQASHSFLKYDFQTA